LALVFFVQGGFGQVLEVVKRDCGKRYAMKVMHKEMMRRCLGSSWRKKIWLEKDLMASLSHPLLVNLLYAFQNQASKRGGWGGRRSCSVSRLWPRAAARPPTRASYQ
jgi:serine/threonine protein kinase